MSKETHHRIVENPRPVFNIHVPIASFLGTFYYIAMPMTDLLYGFALRSCSRRR
jgi:hypothetical protein